MAKKTTIGIAHSDADLGKPAEYSREQLDLVKAMIKGIADGTMGGMSNIVKPGDKVLIKINTVIPVPANAGFTTDPRMLEALVELVKEQNPARIQLTHVPHNKFGELDSSAAIESYHVQFFIEVRLPEQTANSHTGVDAGDIDGTP